MTDPINTNNRVKVPNPATENRAKTESNNTGKSTKTGPASSVVELSSDQIMKQMENLPEVNSNRIESIKNALANGDYQPDPEMIARKFAEIEKLLP
jgi:negative regulator of flagellin synthesis FlgM